jgi:putative membrane protein
MKLTTIFAIAAASALVAAGPAAAQSQDQSAGTQKSAKSGESKSDAKHLEDLAIANMSEIEAGKLALGKAQDPKVKEFAQRMVDDHSKLLDDVKSLAQSKGVDLPSAPDAKHQKVMKKLQSKSGAQFDREYMQAMVKDHREAIKLLKRTEKSAKDEDVKQAANKAEPEIQDHLKMAQQIAKEEKSQKRSARGGTNGKSGSQGSQAGAAR